MTWTAVSGAAHYQVWFHTAPESSQATRFTGDADDTDTTCTITGLTNGTPYYFWITASNDAGTSDFSPPSSTTPYNDSVIDLAQDCTVDSGFGYRAEFARYQTFVANLNPNLSSVVIKVRRPGTEIFSPLTVTLFDVDANNLPRNALATTSLTTTAVGLDYAEHTVPLVYSGLVAGQVYAVVLGVAWYANHDLGYQWCSGGGASPHHFGKAVGWNTLWTDESSTAQGWLQVNVTAEPVTSAFTLDMSQPCESGFTFGRYDPSNGARDELFRYSTFDPGAMGVITGVTLKVRKKADDSTNPITVELWNLEDGRPSARLARVTQDMDAVGTDFQEISIPMDYPRLLNGDSYAVVLGAVDAEVLGNAGFEWCADHVEGSTTDFGKGDGQTWVSESYLGPAWMVLSLDTQLPPSPAGLDLSNTATTGARFGYSTSTNASELYRYQTFVAPPQAVLTDVTVKVRKKTAATTGDLSIQVMGVDSNHRPDNQVLASEGIRSDDVTTDFAEHAIQLHYLGLVTGREYAIVLGQGVDPPIQGQEYEWCSQAQDPPPHHFGKGNGVTWVDESSTGQGWLKLQVTSTYFLF